jgi:hypothetical protein
MARLRRGLGEAKLSLGQAGGAQLRPSAGVAREPAGSDGVSWFSVGCWEFMAGLV